MTHISNDPDSMHHTLSLECKAPAAFSLRKRVDFTLAVPINLDPRANLWRQDVVKLAAILITLVKDG